MKRFTRKQLVIGGTSLLLLAFAGTTFALTRPEAEHHATKSNSLSTQKQTVATEDQTPTTEEPATTQSATDAQNTPTAAPIVSETPTSTTAGGTGVQVSDKTGAMTSAGIADQVSADKVITTLSNWRYMDDGSKTLCAAIPAAKMARFGSDYLTNPVTQLKYCNWLATAQYGSWANWVKALGA